MKKKNFYVSIVGKDVRGRLILDHLTVRAGNASEARGIGIEEFSKNASGFSIEMNLVTDAEKIFRVDRKKGDTLKYGDVRQKATVEKKVFGTPLLKPAVDALKKLERRPVDEELNREAIKVRRASGFISEEAYAKEMEASYLAEASDGNHFVKVMLENVAKGTGLKIEDVVKGFKAGAFSEAAREQVALKAAMTAYVGVDKDDDWNRETRVCPDRSASDTKLGGFEAVAEELEAQRRHDSGWNIYDARQYENYLKAEAVKKKMDDLIKSMPGTETVSGLLVKTLGNWFKAMWEKRQLRRAIGETDFIISQVISLLKDPSSEGVVFKIHDELEGIRKICKDALAKGDE